jgi:hypothetical protein
MEDRGTSLNCSELIPKEVKLQVDLNPHGAERREHGVGAAFRGQGIGRGVSETDGVTAILKPTELRRGYCANVTSRAKTAAAC